MLVCHYEDKPPIWQLVISGMHHVITLYSSNSLLGEGGKKGRGVGDGCCPVGWEVRREPRREGMSGRATFAVNRTDSVNNVNTGISLWSGPDAGSLTFSVRVRRRLSDFVQLVNLKYVKYVGIYTIINLLALGIYLATNTMLLPLLVPVFSADVESWAGKSFGVVPDIALLIFHNYFCGIDTGKQLNQQYLSFWTLLI